MFSRETQALTRQHRAFLEKHRVLKSAPCVQMVQGEDNPKICSDPESPADRPLSGSVGRVDPTRIWAPLGCRVGRSVGSFRPKIFFAALRAAVGRSVFTESETQKSHCVGRSVDDETNRRTRRRTPQEREAHIRDRKRKNVALIPTGARIVRMRTDV